LADLSYRQRIEALQIKHGSQFVFIPMISREAVDASVYLSGRIPQAITTGYLEARAGIQLNAQDSQVMLCGNPQMIEDTMQTLAERGLQKHRRRAPGQVTVEHYW